MHRNLVAVLDAAADLVDVTEVDFGVDSLGEQVQPERHQADVAGAFAVPEQTPLDPVGAGHDPELRGGHGTATIVVRMQGQHDLVPAGQVARHPLDLVGVDVGRGHLDRRGQVQHHRPVRRRLPDVHDRLAHLKGVLQLCSGERLRAVLPADVACAQEFVRVTGTPLRALNGDVGDALAIEPEHDAPLQRRGRVVQMHQDPGCPDQRRDRPLDQFLTGLGQYLDGDVRGDVTALDQLTDEVEVRLARGGEADLDLLVAHLDQQREHLHLARGRHRVDQCLVAVSQVHAAPPGCVGDRAGGPGAVGQIHRWERPVLVDGHARRLLRGSHCAAAPASGRKACGGRRTPNSAARKPTCLRPRRGS